MVKSLVQKLNGRVAGGRFAVAQVLVEGSFRNAQALDTLVDAQWLLTVEPCVLPSGLNPMRATNCWLSARCIAGEADCYALSVLGAAP